MGHPGDDDERNNENSSATIATSDSTVITPPGGIHTENGIVTQLKDFIPSGLFAINHRDDLDLKKKHNIGAPNEATREHELNKRNLEASNIHKKKMDVVLRSEIELEAIKKRVNGEKSGKKGWENFWKRTMADMLNKRLLPVKTLFFFKAATLFVLYPFLTLHIKSLGLDAAEAGINSAFIPIVAIIGPPIAGVIADKIGNFKIFLAAMTLVTAGTGLLLLLVPIARETVTLPTDITFAFGCGSSDSASVGGGPLQLEMMGNNECTLNFTAGNWRGPNPSDVQCGMVCPTGKSVSSANEISNFPLPTGQKYLLPGGTHTFEPFADKRPDLICNGQGTKNATCFFGFSEVTSTNTSTLAIRVKTDFSEFKVVNPSDPSLLGQNVTHLTLNVLGHWEFDRYKFDSAPSCIQSNHASHNGTIVACVEKCLVNLEREMFCSNTHQTLIYDVALTFWMYTFFRVILGLGSATTWIMFEGAVLAILKECGGDYGLQRVSALLAAILVAPFSGTLIYIFHDFRPAFYLYAILQTLSAFLTLKIDLTFKKPAEEVLGHLKEVLSQIEILIFFFAMFLSGSVWGYLESFLFWFLKNLGGNEVLMGLTVSVGGLAGLPLLLFSRVIIKKLGHVNVLCIGLLVYCIRLCGYSIIENPWACLPMEAMEAVTNSLAIIAAATYAAALSTEQTIASIQGFMGALYFGIGRGAGSLVGGFLMKWYGDRVTFQIFAAVALISSIIYFIVNQAYLKKHSKVKNGIDLSNLRGDRTDEEACPDNTHSGPEAPNRSNVEADRAAMNINTFDITKMNGGYVGPCDINAFTDIPLDEEESGQKQQEEEENNAPRARPASFPQKSKGSLSLENRPAES